MNRDSPSKAVMVVMLTALVCSGLVSAAVVLLRPIQLNNQMLEQSRNIMRLTGLLPEQRQVEDEEMLDLFQTLDRRIVNIDSAGFDEEIDPLTFNQRRADSRKFVFVLNVGTIVYAKMTTADVRS